MCVTAALLLSTDTGLFCGYTRLFGGYTGLFCVYTGIFLRIYRALSQMYRALFRKFRALFRVWRAFLQRFVRREKERQRKRVSEGCCCIGGVNSVALHTCDKERKRGRE